MKTRFEDSYMGRLRAKIGHELVITPAVRVVLENNAGEILLVRRADNGLWACPAGLPEQGESAEIAAKREVLEEAGLILNSFECFGFSSHPEVESHTYPNGDRTHAYALLFCSSDFSGHPHPADGESSEVRFFKPTEFPPRAEFQPCELRSLELYFEWKKTRRFKCI